MEIKNTIKILAKKPLPFYICPICNFTEIKNDWLFCPVCGREIEILIKGKRINNRDKVEKLYKKKYKMEVTNDFMIRYKL